MKWRFFRIATFVCLIASLALSIEAYWQWTRLVPSVVTRPLINWSPQLPHQNAQELGGVGPQTLDPALQRPVFSPTRRPFVATAEPPASEPVVEQPAPEVPVHDEQPAVAGQTPPPQFFLKGIRISPDRSSAFMSTAEMPAGQWLAVGDQMSGWTLKAIENNAVTMMAGEQASIVQLYVDNSQNGLGEPLPTR